MSSSEVPQPKVKLPLKYAGFWIRLAAFLVDSLILIILSLATLLMKDLWVLLVISGIAIAYKPVTEGWLGGTAGKLVFNLRVVDRKGQFLGLAGAFVRAGIFILPSIPGLMFQVKMKQENISRGDVEAVQRFIEANQVLFYSSQVFYLLIVISCVAVAFNTYKQGWHDRIADSYVVYSDES